MNPADRYAWPVPADADTARALDGISGDLARGLPPKLDEALIFLAAVRAADPDRPVPYTLTAKACAVLGEVPDGQWACTGCGDAWFGTAPEDGLCPACEAPRAAPGWPAPGPCPGPGADWREAGWCCRACAVLAHPPWCPDCRGAGQ